MDITAIPFATTEWEEVPSTEHPGVSGTATWRTRTFGDIRVRMVRYSADYCADHWCERGHILLVLEGSLETQLADGRTVFLDAGMSYQVGDLIQPHRSRTADGALLFIVD